MIRRSTPFVAAVLVSGLIANRAQAYVDLAPTLGKIVNDSKSIALVEVTTFDPATQTLTLKSLKTIKGDEVAGTIMNRVAPDNGVAPPAVRRWASPGARGVWFATKTTALVCMGTDWYQARRTGGEWKLGVDRPDLPLAYCGRVMRLSDAVTNMVAGGRGTITAIVYGATDVDTSFDLALGRNGLPGLAKVHRLRASLDMPQVVAATAESDVVIGPGAYDISDLPQLVVALNSEDAAARADAAEAIGELGKAGEPARAKLVDRLNDDSPEARCAAAAAILKLSPDDAAAKKVLAADLTDANAATRHAAAIAVAYAGPGGGKLARQIMPLLAEKNDSVKGAALLAMATLAPSFAADDAKAAAKLLTPMLGDVRWRIEAADALGRLGRAIRPAPAALATLIADPQPSVRWAGVRALAQIGGPEARPAVEYIKTALPTGSEVEQYNMMIYLSLLGPVASDAAPVIRANRIKNPVLPGATLWAIGDTTHLPWQQQGGNRFGGPGGGPGGGGPGNLHQYMYAAYIRELGDRLKPAAASLANKMLDGTAGDVPDYGYGLLTADAAGVLGILVPKLKDGDSQIRQRAAIALGHMGNAAASARPALLAAAHNATDEKEKRMLNWAAKKIDD